MITDTRKNNRFSFISLALPKSLGDFPGEQKGGDQSLTPAHLSGMQLLRWGSHGCSWAQDCCGSSSFLLFTMTRKRQPACGLLFPHSTPG